ncbi:MAG: Rv2175c family DNA-binding protein [Microbacteriaceae bacterium]|nr:Rv2175c family DNA-binding protein [Microbacteriaceae bacterium]
MQLTETYTVPDLVEMLDLSPGQVRRLFEERVLAAVKIDGVLRVPAEFLLNGQPVAGLRGTLILLDDNGLDIESAVAWLLEPNEYLDGETPISQLRLNHKTPVRRAAAFLL